METKQNRKHMRFGIVLLACGLLASMMVAFGCAQASTPSAKPQLEETNALVIYAQDGNYLFVDTDTNTVFYPMLDSAVVDDEDGREIPLSDLAVGDKVVVGGDGAMTMSYPAQYPGISRVTIVSRDNMEDVAAYQSIVNALFPAIDPNSVPVGSLSYRNSYGEISVMLNAYGFEGFNPDGTTMGQQGSVSFVNESGIMIEGTPDVSIAGPVDAVVEFDRSFQSAVLTRRPIVDEPEQRIHVELDAPQEAVGTTITGNGELSFSLEPGYAYSLNVRFAEGEASYAFFAAEATA